MIASKMQSSSAVGLSRGPRSVPVVNRSSRQVVCGASKTAWESWNGYMEKRTPVPALTADEKKYSSEVAAAVKAASATYKPKFSVNTDASIGASFKLQHQAKPAAAQLPADLHERLETVGLQQLKAALGDAPLDAATVSFTTTDVNAALSVTGCIAQQGSERTALLAFVASETERQASWSRLEGLILHWGCAEKLGGGWAPPPSGWSASPDKTKDAGGAQECGFEKQAAGQGQQYVMMLQLPLKGTLKSGGLIFVLKATAAQNTKWLKDAGKNADFFLDLQKLPVVKL